jgi:hypothetical protein
MAARKPILLGRKKVGSEQKGSTLHSTPKMAAEQQNAIAEMRKKVTQRFLREKGFTGRLPLKNDPVVVNAATFLKRHSVGFPEKAPKSWYENEANEAKSILSNLAGKNQRIYSELENLTKFFYLKEPPLVESDVFHNTKRELIRRMNEIEKQSEALELFLAAAHEPTEKNIMAFGRAVNPKKSASFMSIIFPK